MPAVSGSLAAQRDRPTKGHLRARLSMMQRPSAEESAASLRHASCTLLPGFDRDPFVTWSLGMQLARPLTLVLLLLLQAATARAVIKEADILVTDNESNHLVRVDPDTGEQIELEDQNNVTLCSGVMAPFSPQGLDVDANRNVFLVNVHSQTLASEVLVFREDGSCESVASGPDLVDSDDVAVEPAGTLIVSSSRCASCGPGSPPAIIRVDPLTGVQTPLAIGSLLTDPELLAVDPEDGSIYVADDGDPGNGIAAAIIRVDPVSGEQTRVSQAGLFFNLSGIAMEAGGTLVVTDRGDKLASGVASQTKVIRVDPALPMPNQTRLDDPASLPTLFGNSRPEYDGVAAEQSGQLIVGVQVDGPIGPVLGPNAGLIRLQPDNGAQTLMAFGGPLFSPGRVLEGVDGVTIVPEPSIGALHGAAMLALGGLGRWQKRRKQPGFARRLRREAVAWSS
jgi:sugar lactone lactonase YvrE